MNADVESLVLEQLRAIRAKVDKIDDDLGDLRQRMSSVERHMANLQGDVANIHERLDRQGERLDRIERRLDLSEAPPDRKPRLGQRGRGVVGARPAAQCFT